MCRHWRRQPAVIGRGMARHLQRTLEEAVTRSSGQRPMCLPFCRSLIQSNGRAHSQDGLGLRSARPAAALLCRAACTHAPRELCFPAGMQPPRPPASVRRSQLRVVEPLPFFAAPKGPCLSCAQPTMPSADGAMHIQACLCHGHWSSPSAQALPPLPVATSQCFQGQTGRAA